MSTTAARPCPESGRVRSLLARRADDSITPADGRSLKAHLLACPECADAAVAVDPTLLFVPLSPSAEGRGGRRDEKRAAQLRAEADRVVADVLAAVDVERSKRRLDRSPSLALQRRALMAASVALVGAGLLGYLSWKRNGGPERLAWKGNVVAPSASASASAIATLATTATAVSPDRLWSPSDRERPVIEDLKNPGATVYEFASASPQEATLVFIVDRNADI